MAQRLNTVQRPSYRSKERAARNAPAASARPVKNHLPQSKSARNSKGARISKGKLLENLAFFGRQLCVLVSCGTPVVQSLMALERQASDASWAHIIGKVRASVEEGATLAESMRAQPHAFDTISCTLVEAGEAAGNLPVMLDRMAELMRQRLELRQSVRGALTYPALLVFVAGSALTAMIMVVLPRFAGLFETLDVPLPPTTKMLLATSSFLASYWWAVGLGLLALGIVVWLALRVESGKQVRDTLVLSVPRIGPIVKSFAVARITRLLGVLLQSHVPLLDALELTRLSTENQHYRNLLTGAADAVRRGDPLSSAFTDAKLVSASVHEAIRSGEQSGQIGPLLGHLADFADKDNEATIRSLTSILEPLILMVLGLLIGIVAISLFMPLFDLTAMSGGAR